MAEDNSSTTHTNDRRAFGKYELLETIETGPIAELFKARDRERNRMVLLRAMTRSASENPSIRQLFTELQAERTRFIADDPYVLKVTEVGRSAGRFYLAFEHMDGVSLRKYFEEHRPSIEEAVSILRQATEGLRAFHQRRLTHGDVKPSNIFVGSDATSPLRVKLSPIDIATAASESMVSIYGELVGTPHYLSPEQIEGRPVEMRSDIFSLGVVAFELFAGRKPFDAESPLAAIRANVDTDAPPLAQVDTTIPPEISLVVSRMLSRDPRRRYRNAQNLLEDLDRVEAKMAGERAETVPHGADSVFAAQLTPHPATKPSSLYRNVAVAAATAAGVLLVVLILVLAGVISVQQPAPAPTNDTGPSPAPMVARGSDDPARPRDPEAYLFDQAVRRVDEHANSKQYDSAIDELMRFMLARPDLLA